ncbi:GatB/YqeY domain-containing protein [Alphaproteobacteria bacterium LSUCC0719]
MANLREDIAEAMKNALKAKDQTALATMRLISAALKDRDIAARGSGNQDGISDEEILSMMQTMIKQRTESAKMYRDGDRPELAEAEEAEIEIIIRFLPAQLGDAEIAAAIDAAIEATGAASIKDMGQVMSHLKSTHAGQMDFSVASQKVKAALLDRG